MTITLSQIRNIAIVGPQSSGKTVLTETFLFLGKALKTLSTMGGRKCPLDEEPEEIERGLTLTPQVYTFNHLDHEFTLIDTPGYNKFLADTRCCLRACDGAVLVLSATSNIKAEVRDYWSAVKEFEVPRFIFLNMMDKEKANFNDALHAIEKGCGILPVCLTIPMGAEHNLSGVIDLLSMKALKFAADKSGKVQEVEIPAEFAIEAKAQREKLIEAIVETDEKLMSDYLEGKEISFDQLLPLLQQGIVSHKLAPVFAGSCALNVGVAPLIKALCDFFPAPNVRKSDWAGLMDDMKTEGNRSSTVTAPFSALVFKTSVDHFAGKVNFCRIVSGKIKINDTVLVMPTNHKPRVAHLARSLGRHFTKVEEAVAGQIVALEKIDHLENNQTISDVMNGFYYPPITRPEPQISLAVIAKEREAEDKIAEALTKMHQEDANISYKVVKDTKQLVLSGTGQFHLEILKKKIERKYHVTFDLQPPRVTYKEAFKKTVEAQGKYKKQTGGHGQYGDCWIRLTPTARDTGFEFMDEVKGGAIPRNFIPSVEKGVREAMGQGFIAGYPIIDFKAAVYDGSYHDVDSSDMAFKVAGSMAFKKCMETANPVLLEPIMSVEIRIALDYMGATIQDLNSRRGHVLGMEADGDLQIIKALVPQAEMLTYDNTLQGITQGSGYFTMKHKAYEEAPPIVASKVIEAYKKSKGTAEKEHE